MPLNILFYFMLSTLLFFTACQEEITTIQPTANTPPQLQPLTPLQFQADTNTSLSITATDADHDVLIFSITDQPNFISVIDEHNGTLRLNFLPKTEDIGTYENIVITLSDGTTTQHFTLKVTIQATSTPQQCDYYLDPLQGDITNNGTLLEPWSTLQELFSSQKSLQGGTTLCLLSGDHGRVSINNYHFSEPLLIEAKEGHTPWVHALNIINSDHISINTLLIDGQYTTPSSNPSTKTFLLNSDVNAHHLTFDQLTIKSADDISSWTKSDWYNKVHSGAWLRGDYITMTHTLILNTYHALEFDGDHSYLAHSTIDNFAGDGIRGNGSFSTYEYNTVRDCYINDYNIQHDDAFQTFDLSSDPKVQNVTLRFNKFLLFEDPITPFITAQGLIGDLMQGVIITDGYAERWIVENNLIVNNQLHGISLYGVRNSRVQNNTVVQHPYYSDLDVPRIYLDKSSKTGQLNFNNIIRNNITSVLTTWTYANDTVVEGNIILDRTQRDAYLSMFQDYDRYDFHLKVDATAIDAGVDSTLTPYDLDQKPRVNGAQVDAGAYEFY